MKKIKYLLLFLLFVPLLTVKADILTCGTYRSENAGKTCISPFTIDSSGKCIAEDVSFDFDNKQCNSYGILSLCDVPISLSGLDFDAGNTIAVSFDSTITDCPNEINIYNVKDYRRGWEYVVRLGFYSGDPDIALENTLKFERPIPLTPSNKYDYIETCEGGPYEYIAECGCMPTALTDLTSRIYNLVKILAPALLIIVGGFDLIKAVTAADEKAIQKEQTKLIKKFIAAFAVFMLFTVIQLLTQWISKEPGNTIDCVGYIVNGWKEK